MNDQDYSHSDLLAEVDEALAEQTFRQELRTLISAPKGSDLAKARSTLGWMLLLLGLFGIPMLFFVIMLIASAFGGIFGLLF